MFSVDSYAFTSYRSHASGPRLTSQDFSTAVGWTADWYDATNRGQPQWQFISPGGDEVVRGGFDELVHLEVFVDGVAGVVFGRLIRSEGTSETAHYPISPAQISSLTEVELEEDFRDSLYLGVELDNILVEEVCSP